MKEASGDTHRPDTRRWVPQGTEFSTAKRGNTGLYQDLCIRFSQVFNTWKQWVKIEKKQWVKIEKMKLVTSVFEAWVYVAKIEKIEERVRSVLKCESALAGIRSGHAVRTDSSGALDAAAMFAGFRAMNVAGCTRM